MKRLSFAVTAVLMVVMLTGCTEAGASNISKDQAGLISKLSTNFNGSDFKSIRYIMTQFNQSDWERYGEKVQEIYISSERDAGTDGTEAIALGCEKFIQDKTQCIANLNGLTIATSPIPSPETSTSQPTTASAASKHIALTSGQKQVYIDQISKLLEDKNVSDISIGTSTETGEPIAYVQLQGTLPKESMDENEMTNLCRIVAGRINECGIYQYNIELVDSNSQMAMTYNEQTE